MVLLSCKPDSKPTSQPYKLCPRCTVMEQPTSYRLDLKPRKQEGIHIWYYRKPMAESEEGDHCYCCLLNGHNVAIKVSIKITMLMATECCDLLCSSQW